MRPTVMIIVLGVVAQIALANAQSHGEGRIVVLVTNGATKQVIENARVVVEPGGISANTNAEGVAHIPALTAGTYRLYISADEYDRMQVLKVSVTDSASIGISTSLRGKAPVEGSDVEAPGDGTYLLFMETLPSIKGGIGELARIVVYPEMAQRAGLEGTVHVRVYISDTGSAVKAVVERSAIPVLDRAALDAVMKIGFEPAKHGGRNVKSVITLPIRFFIGR